MFKCCVLENLVSLLSACCLLATLKYEDVCLFLLWILQNWSEKNPWNLISLKLDIICVQVISALAALIFIRVALLAPV